MRPSAEAERLIGVDWFVTDGPPCPALVRSTPEDFKVEELLSTPDITAEPREDYLPLYRVEKRSIDTMHMAKEMSAALRSRVAYAGLKDKKAIAVQYLTPSSRRSERPPRIVREKFTAGIVGYVPTPLTRSSLVGNRFSVVLRMGCPEIGQRLDEALGAASKGKIPNFYGPQRFGASRAGTHVIGRAMVRGEFRSAVTMMVTQDASGPVPEAEEALAGERYDDLVRIIPGARDTESAVARALAKNPGEWVKALRAIPVRLRRLYVQAYQSFIFNKTMSMAVKEEVDFSGFVSGDNWADASDDGLTVRAPRGVKDTPTKNAVPLVQLVGFAFRDYGSRFDALTKVVLEEERVDPGRFYVDSMQEVSQEGGFRRPNLVVKDAGWVTAGEATTVGFALPKGQYATVLLREVVKAQGPEPAGLV